jgi:hypothetical protein
MSRGLGQVQRRVLGALQQGGKTPRTTRWVAVSMYGLEVSASQESAVRRALAALWRRGEVVRVTRSYVGGTATWTLPAHLPALLLEVQMTFGIRAADIVCRMVTTAQMQHLRRSLRTGQSRGLARRCGGSVSGEEQQIGPAQPPVEGSGRCIAPAKPGQGPDVANNPGRGRRTPPLPIGSLQNSDRTTTANLGAGCGRVERKQGATP